MKALDRLTLLLIGALAGSALTLLILSVSQIGSDAAATGRMATSATVIAVVAMAIALIWTGVKRRKNCR